MTKYVSILLLMLVLACDNPKQGKKMKETEALRTTEIVSDEYELFQPTAEVKAVLILFGGYPESPKDIKEQFNILTVAGENQVAVVLMNYNQKLYLEEDEKLQLAQKTKQLLDEHQLNNTDIYIGGFSSGGNVSLLLSSYLVSNSALGIIPKGVFIVDSPIDLSQLYFASEKNIARNFSKVSVDESNWIIENLGQKFGNPHDDISAYEKYAIYTYKTSDFRNLKNLKNLKMRFYTEPDTIWWRQHRMADYEQTNAYYIKELAKSLKENGFKGLEYIPTQNRGYRANGERHPHSWSIVDEKDLIEWMLD